MNKADFIQAVESASDSNLMMSKKHCHAMHVSSIVLDSSGGRLLRAFLAWPGHELVNNASPYGATPLTVGIHNHRYDLTIHPICGFVLNVRYERSFACHPGAREYDSYEFRTGVESRKLVANKIGSELLVRKHEHLITDKTTMEAEELHTIAVFGVAAWLVEEGPLRREQTQLFSNSPIVADERFYEPFDDVRSVIDHCNKFMNQPCLNQAATQ